MAHRLTRFRAIAARLGVLAAAAALLGLGPLAVAPPAAAASCPGADLCLTVVTTNDSPSLSLPLGGTVAVTVDWGDGSAPENFTSPGDTPAHAFPPNRTYTVTIAPDVVASPTGPWLTAFGDPDSYPGASLITGVDAFGTLGITSLAGAFDGATALAVVPSALPPGVTDLNSAFRGAESFDPAASGASIDGWDTSAVTDMADLFDGASGFDSPIGSWDTSHVTDMSGMFANAVAFDQPLGDWNTTRVTTMHGMFDGAAVFNQPVAAWDTAAVTDMSSMFAGATAFDQPVDAWGTGAVVSLANMFNGAYAFDQPLGGWDTHDVTDMSGAFSDATSFDQPLGGWDTGAVTTTSGMFAGATAFDQPLEAWSTDQVTDMSSMFANAVAFDQPLAEWKTGAVTDMDDMFDGAVGFDQSIGGWDIARVTSMAHMFGDSAGLSLGDYDQLLTGWAGEAVHPGVVFDAGASAYNGLASAAHAVLTSATGDDWTITDGGITDAQITPVIETPPVASGITYGQRLGASRLTGGVADTAGAFSFAMPADVPGAGLSRVALRFVPASPYYATVQLTIPLQVAKARATLRLAGLRPVRHGQNAIVTVARLVPGARLTIVWRCGRYISRRTLTVGHATVRVALALRVRGDYRVTASATDPNVTFGAGVATVRAT